MGRVAASSFLDIIRTVPFSSGEDGLQHIDYLVGERPQVVMSQLLNSLQDIGVPFEINRDLQIATR